MGFIKVRLADDVHDKWKAYCEGIGLRPSTAIRRSMEEHVQTVVAPMALSVGGGKKMVTVHLRITESEREGIRMRTKLDGGTRSGWIAKAIRSALTQAPIIGAEQTEKIQQSNYQLSRIGGNLNQIARRLNEHQDARINAVELAELQAIRKQIDAHVSEVETLISTVAGRGNLEH